MGPNNCLKSIYPKHKLVLIVLENIVPSKFNFKQIKRIKSVTQTKLRIQPPYKLKINYLGVFPILNNCFLHTQTHTKLNTHLVSLKYVPTLLQ